MFVDGFSVLNQGFAEPYGNEGSFFRSSQAAKYSKKTKNQKQNCGALGQPSHLPQGYPTLFFLLQKILASAIEKEQKEKDENA